MHTGIPTHIGEPTHFGTASPAGSYKATTGLSDVTMSWTTAPGTAVHVAVGIAPSMGTPQPAHTGIPTHAI